MYLFMSAVFLRTATFLGIYSTGSCGLGFRMAQRLHMCTAEIGISEPVFVNLFEEPRIRFQVWWAGMSTLFDVPARHARLHRIDSWAGPPDLESNPGLQKRLQILALSPKF
jgi:hypothetical protein